jgi:hypothetical protein
MNKFDSQRQSMADFFETFSEPSYSRSELSTLDTIEQSWDGAELKIEDEGYRVWLNPRENAKYDGDYTIETLDQKTGRWNQEKCYFN